jgi:hypothetical protein
MNERYFRTNTDLLKCRVTLQGYQNWGQGHRQRLRKFRSRKGRIVSKPDASGESLHRVIRWFVVIVTNLFCSFDVVWLRVKVLLRTH